MTHISYSANHLAVCLSCCTRSLVIVSTYVAIKDKTMAILATLVICIEENLLSSLDSFILFG